MVPGEFPVCSPHNVPKSVMLPPPPHCFGQGGLDAALSRNCQHCSKMQLMGPPLCNKDLPPLTSGLSTRALFPVPQQSQESMAGLSGWHCSPNLKKATSSRITALASQAKFTLGVIPLTSIELHQEGIQPNNCLHSETALSGLRGPLGPAKSFSYNSMQVPPTSSLVVPEVSRTQCAYLRIWRQRSKGLEGAGGPETAQEGEKREGHDEWSM